MFRPNIVLKIGSKTYERIEAAMDEFAKPYRVMDKYLRLELADGLDHCGRSFFKDLWDRNQGPPGIKMQTHGIFHHLWRQPLGSGRVFKVSSSQKVTVRAFMNSPVKTMNMGMKLFSDSNVAKYHEGGDTIKAKGGKMAVPMPPWTNDKTQKAGNFMYTSDGRLKLRYKNPKSLGLVAIKLNGAKGTQIYLCKSYKKSKRVLPMYVLKDSVTLKKRLHFEDLYNEKQAHFREILDKSFEKGLQNFKKAEWEK